MKRSLLIGGGLLCGAALVTFLNFYSPHSGTTLQKRLFDAGHFVVFGTFSLAMLAAVEGLFPRRTTLFKYAAAALVTVMAGLLTEFAQVFEDRDASWTDMLRNLAGLVSLLGFAAVLDRRVHGPRAGKPLVLLLSAACFCACFYSVAELQAGLWKRNRIQPVLVDLRSPVMRDLWYGVSADTRVEKSSKSDSVLVKVTFAPGSKYPRFVIRDLYPDWSEWRVLAFEVRSEASAPAELYIRLHDEEHNHKYDDRYNGSFALSSELRTIRIPLDSLRYAPRERLMDLTRMDSMAIFTVEPADTFSVWLGNFRLERREGGSSPDR